MTEGAFYAVFASIAHKFCVRDDGSIRVARGKLDICPVSAVANEVLKLRGRDRFTILILTPAAKMGLDARFAIAVARAADGIAVGRAGKVRSKLLRLMKGGK